MKRVNIGCGEVFHADWFNLDVSPVAPDVRRLDVRKPLPFADGEVDAVYHSHVLEHLTTNEGARMLAECFRVLKPGGIVRVAVPDLEGIARAYLDALAVAEAGGDPTLYEWCRLEMTDQLARTVSGGEMAPWLLRLTPDQQEIVGRRAGWEMTGILATGGRRRTVSWSRRDFAKALRWLHRYFVRGVVRLTGGRAYMRAFDEGVFRQRGEVHRVMYERHALAQALKRAGFEGAKVVGAEESAIAGYATYGLDVIGGKVRKPDSLFMEARRP